MIFYLEAFKVSLQFKNILKYFVCVCVCVCVCMCVYQEMCAKVRVKYLS